MENRCVCCGAVVPEGRMVCPICEMAADEKVAITLDHEKLDITVTYVYVSKSNVRNSYNKYM